MKDEKSSVKLMGQMNLEFDEFAIHGKLMKIEIQRNQNQVIWNYNKRDILFSKLASFCTKNYEKMKNTMNYFAKLKI